MIKTKRPSRQGSAKSRKKKWPLFLIFVMGFVIAAYPLVSQYYYRIESSREIAAFDGSVSQIDREELAERLRLAQAFNSSLKPGEAQLLDPFSDKERAEGVTEYGHMLEINERLGYVDIPRINEKIPMYVGTGDDVLERGAGLLEGTSLPVGGTSTHTVITAHRGLPTAQLFTKLDRLEKGDVFYLHVLDQVLAYEVDQIVTVEPSDFEAVMIQEGQDYATLLTCTPYMINSHRLLVRGKRVNEVAPVQEKNTDWQKRGHDYLVWLVVASVVLLFLVIVALRYRTHIRQLLQGMEK